MSAESIERTCCVVGGGPAGMMLGYLLARAGVQVTVLEKHRDFFRDFRGDTVHPSTLELFHELGLLEESTFLLMLRALARPRIHWGKPGKVGDLLMAKHRLVLM
jgi:2-polyprenyl-6-methoxyphenol hydroxylase-like FAD-dependent oxidoreductase